MQITVNGQLQEIPEGLTISELVRHLGLEGPVAIEKNGAVVPRAAHAQTPLAPGDVLEIVHFVGGG